MMNKRLANGERLPSNNETFLLSINNRKHGNSHEDHQQKGTISTTIVIRLVRRKTINTKKSTILKEN